MKNAFNKEVARSITRSFGRFLAIAIICALGCGFYAGLLMTSIDMKLSADAYYDGTNLSDIYVTSTLGLDDESVEAIAGVAGVKAVEPVRLVDAYALLGDSKYVIRFNSLNMDAAIASDTSDAARAESDDDGYINRPVLVEGSWPSKPGECVISADAVLDEPVAVGDTVEIIDFAGDTVDSFARKEYVVCGLVQSSYYLMTSNFGSSELGSGEIDTFAYVYPEDFSSDLPYTGAFVTVEGALEQQYPSGGYDEAVDVVIKRIESISDRLSAQRLASIKADAQDELDEARAEYESERASAMAKLDSAQGELVAAKAQLDHTAQTLAEGEATIDRNYAALDDGFRQAELTYEELESKRHEVLEAYYQYKEGMQRWYDAVDAAEASFARQQEQVNLIGDLEQRAKAQALLDEQRKAAASQFAEQKAQLDATNARLEAAFAEIDAAFEQLLDEQGRLEQGVISNGKGLDQLRAARALYEKGVANYESGVASYERERQSALSELADARAKIDEAQADIDAIEAPEIFILDRSKNVGVASDEADADRIDQIAQVFPLIFFLVAALVSLTTMTRMVVEERMLIGTYKALGYSNRRITSKYLVYALIASGIGSIVGILILSQALPQVIMRAYSVIYVVPVFLSPINIPVAAAAFCLSVGITLIATWFAVASSLREKPAALLLPRAPKPGKRILLERTGPLWRHMSFSSKVTARNIFRYKRRFFMAVIGVAGCTALLLTGLGLYDGINDIIEKQFGEIQHFNLEIQSSDSQSARSQEEIQAILDGSDIVTATTRVDSENVIASNDADSKDVHAMVIVPEDIDEFADFYTLRTRIGHEPLSLDSSEAIVTEKLASELGLQPGDTLRLFEQSTVGERAGSSRSVIVGGITEYYTGQRVFMSPETFESVMGQPCSFSDVLCMAEAPLDQRTELSNQILDVEGVEVVSYYDEIIETYKTMLQTVNAVVIVLIVAAALLAFVVLYNLTNINITERTREIATLKVLGFTPRETNAYIFRETLILTVIGALVGCVLGVWMESFVVVTAEVDQMMFGREIHPMSFVISFVLTIVFSIIVSLAMGKKIKRIDMVESLKSVD